MHPKTSLKGLILIITSIKVDCKVDCKSCTRLRAVLSGEAQSTLNGERGKKKRDDSK
jgi:hypothetical protein